jgi:uncharacterized protein
MNAKKGLLIYFAVLIPLSAALEAVMIWQKAMGLAVILMWVPALASVVARLALHEGFGDVSFRLGARRGGRRGWRGLGLALVYATGIGLVAYGIAWATGLAHFAAPTSGPGAGVTGEPALPRFLIFLLLGNTAITLLSALTAAGEEIGWRGFMLTRLIDAGVPHPVLVSGLIWSLWHLPLILAGLYAAGPSVGLSALLFIITATSIAIVLARLGLATGSIWPAILLHANWNAVIQNVFDRFTTGPGASLWVGESGILVALVSAGVAVWVMRGRWEGRGGGG